MRSYLTLRNVAAAVSGALLLALALSGTAKAITDTIYKYSTPKTGFYTIHPAAFTPDQSTRSFDMGWGLGVSSSDGNTCFNASINLPSGVTVTELDSWFKSTSGAEAFWMARVPVGSTSFDYLANKTDTDTSATMKPVLVPVSQNNVIDNHHYLYIVGFCVANAADIFHGARITYTYANAGD